MKCKNIWCHYYLKKVFKTHKCCNQCKNEYCKYFEIFYLLNNDHMIDHICEFKNNNNKN
jgi:hypothetical protein